VKCKQCSVEITPEENAYSMKHFGASLCRVHQKSIPPKVTVNANAGLSKNDCRYKEGMIKGRIAEALIEELFLALDYNVYRYGMENTVPGIIKLLRGVRSDVADTIRKMPDFVIQNTKTAEVYFIEVKFRANEELTFSDIGGKDFPFENAFFIVVSKKHIKCISYSELQDGKTISPTSHNYLGNRKEFELDKEVIIQFCEFAVKFFSEV
jgi:hypothetical protein